MATDIYATVTNHIIEQLEKGVKPWVRPWDSEKCTGPSAPVNAATGSPYHGVNVLLLAMHKAAFMTGDPRFCTYKQAQDKGWQVRKGEKSTPIVFYKPLEVDNDKYNPQKEDSPATKMIGMLRVFSVFHTSQIDGAPPYKAPTMEECPWLRPDAAQIILSNSKAVITTGGDRAFYSPSTDHINLPPDHAFRGPPEFAAVALHELAHWTGAPHRMNRDLSGGKGSSLYAREELRAEISSAITGATLNIPAKIENHASYVDHYLAILKSDKRELFRAAAEAQRISDYVLNFHPDFAARLQPQPEADNDNLPRAAPLRVASHRL